jgi:hypothetical protein
LAVNACGVLGRPTDRRMRPRWANDQKKRRAVARRSSSFERVFAYFDTDRLNIRSIFSFVASQHD